MKKIIAFLTALVLGVSVMANSLKANAVVVEAGLIAELVQICSSILLGSGAYTQTQISNMSTSDILGSTQEAGLSIDWGANAKLKADVIKSLNSFINDNIKKQGEDISGLVKNGGLSEIVTQKLVDMIHSNADELLSVENPVLNGAACSIIEYCKRSDGSLYVYSITYGTKGLFSNIGDTEFMVIIDYFKTVFYNDDGTILFTRDDTNSSKSFYCKYTSDEYKFCGTWYNKDDGTVNTDLIASPAEIPQAIGTVNVDGEELTVNGDGTVVKDGVTYVINDDGSVTIGDNTYYPDYDLSVYPTTTIINLIGSIADNCDVVEDTTDDLYDDTFENIEGTTVGVETLDNLMLPKTIITVFPFSLPWDFVRGMKLFAAEPETPHFEVNINVPAFLNVPEQNWKIEIDLKQFEDFAKISRWASMISFSFTLIFLTSKIVKGGV